MNFKELQFCLDTIKRGDELYIGYGTSIINKKCECDESVRITDKDISEIIELLTESEKHKNYKSTSIKFKMYDGHAYEMSVEETPILLRKHRNKYYDMDGNKFTIC